MARRTLQQDVAALVRRAPQPGEQGHICECLVPCGDDERVTLVVVALAYSHAMWAEFYLAEDAALPAALEHAWEFFGGAPRTWLFETVRPTASLDPGVLALAQRCGAVPRPFAAHDGVRWGEFLLRYIPERFLRRHLLRYLVLANGLLRSFCENTLWRAHPQRDGRSVLEVLAEERGALHPVVESA
jgi:hypothetical protein